MLLATRASLAHAHTIAVDAAAADWFGTSAGLADVAQLARDATGHSEYLWQDAAQDTRPALGAQPGLDLTEFRVTGDTQRLYFLARLRGPVVTTGAGAPMLQVAIRTGSGATARPDAFVDGANTRVVSGAEWDAMFETRFASGATPRVCDASLHTVGCAAQSAIDGAGVIEGSIPWTALGYPTAPLTPVRFSVALFRADAGDEAQAVGADPSNAVDVVSDGGAPASTPDAASSTAGGRLDYAFDVHFDRNGEPYAPLLITQVSYAQGPSQNWMTVVNVSRVPLSLGEFKVGDAPRPGSGSGGMGTLPDVTLQPGQSFVVCQDGGAFLSKYGFHAGAQCVAGDPTIPVLGACAAWGTQPGLGFATSGDQVLVLDRANTIVDVVAWKHASWPGLVSSPGATGQGLLQRATLSPVTNDCGVDFGAVASAVPGAVPASVAGVGAPTLDGSVQFALAPNPFRASARLMLHLATPTATRVSVSVYDVTGRRVRTLLDDAALSAGATLALPWSGDDDRGRAMPNGVYLFRITTPHGGATLRGLRLR